MGSRETLGHAAGRLSSLATGAGALVRGARLFHPEGLVFLAQVDPVAPGGPLRRLGERLAGPALVRFSNAWWKHGREWPDVLGCAVRLRTNQKATARADARDQDLLFATVRWPLTTPLAPLGTNPHDFLANDYHAVSPFQVDGVGRAKLRLISPGQSPPGDHRMQRLVRAVRAGTANFELQLRRQRPFARFHTVARLRLESIAEIDQERLRFRPDRDGRGIHPAGFVQAMRPAAYSASQAARWHVNGKHDEKHRYPSSWVPW